MTPGRVDCPKSDSTRAIAARTSHGSPGHSADGRRLRPRHIERRNVADGPDNRHRACIRRIWGCVDGRHSRHIGPLGRSLTRRPPDPADVGNSPPCGDVDQHDRDQAVAPRRAMHGGGVHTRAGEQVDGDRRCTLHRVARHPDRGDEPLGREFRARCSLWRAEQPSGERRGRQVGHAPAASGVSIGKAFEAFDEAGGDALGAAECVDRMSR